MLKRGLVRSVPEPCQKFHKSNAAELIRRIKEDRCLQCLAVVRDLQREYEITDALWNRRN